MIRFDVLTLFPGIFDGYLGQSLLDDAIRAGLVEVHRWNIRDWTADKHQKVDDAEIQYAILEHLILIKVRPYKESLTRCFIFNEKLQQVSRVDSIAQSCVLLPESHGLIFPDGYYLAAG